MKLLIKLFICIAASTPWAIAVGSSAKDPHRFGSEFVIVGATLIDGRGSKPLEDSLIFVKDGVIDRIETESESVLSNEVIQLDAKGKFVVPGIVDAHSHVDSVGGIALTEAQQHIALEYYPRAFLFHGVTTLINMSAHNLERVLSLRNEIRQNPSTLAPRIYTGAATFTVAGGWGGRHGGGLESADQVLPRLQEYSKRNFDLVKIIIEEGLGARGVFPKIPKDFLEEIVQESNRLNMPVFIHATDEHEYLEAISLKPRAMAHGLFTPQSKGSPLIKSLKDSNIYVVPTTVLFEAFYAIRDNPALIDDPLLEMSVPGFILESMRKPEVMEAAFKRMDEILRMDSSAWARSAVPDLKANVALFAEAGVKIAIGTDGGGAVVHSFQGYNTPREMELLAECCLSNMETIVAASRTAAELMNAEHEFGTIEPGRSADLLILNSNPLAAIKAIRDFDHLVLRGQVIERETLSFKAFLEERELKN